MNKHERIKIRHRKGAKRLGLQAKDFADNPKNIGKAGDCTKMCSNPFCCGNPRRIRGCINLTVQEQKAAQD